MKSKKLFAGLLITLIATSCAIINPSTSSNSTSSSSTTNSSSSISSSTVSSSSSSSVSSSSTSSSSKPSSSSSASSSSSSSSKPSSSSSASSSSSSSSKPSSSSSASSSSSSSSKPSSSSSASSSSSSSSKPNSSSSSSSSSSKPSSSSSSSSSSEPSSSSKPSTNTNLTVESNAPTYYDSLRGQKGNTLKTNVDSLITSTHKKVTSYNEIRYMFVGSDADPKKPGNILEFYTRDSIDGTWDGNSYNREHCWPQSKLGSYGTTSPGADLHHIRPTYNDLNSRRGSYAMGEVSGGSTYGCGKVGGSVYEPHDGIKGDYARIFFYIMYRWNLDAKDEGAVTSAAASNNYELLREWHELDPVDDYEMRRNNYVYEVQGNRNPFIDHPEFMDMIYDSNYNGDGALNDVGGTTPDLTPEQLVENVENAINAIGTVTLNSKEAIENAENLYNSLSSELKADVENTLVTKLENARKEYNELLASLKPTSILTSEQAIAYMQSEAYVEGEELHVTGVVKSVRVNQYNGYEIALEGGFEVYSGQLASGVSAPEVGDTIKASGKAGTFNRNGTTIYQIAYNNTHKQSPSIYEVIKGSGSTTPPSGGDNDNPPSGGDNDNPPSGEIIATFDFGTNGSSHVDGGNIGGSKSYEAGSYTLSLTNMTNVFAPSYDAKGNSCLKLGSSSKTGSLTFTVPSNVNTVVIYVAKYKDKESKVKVNGKETTLTKNSNDGQYDIITVDTSSTKTVTIETVTGGVRCMINTIEFK